MLSDMTARWKSV